MAEGGQKPDQDKGMVEDAPGQTAGSYTVLRSEREFSLCEGILRENGNAGEEVAQQAQPEEENELGEL